MELKQTVNCRKSPAKRVIHILRESLENFMNTQSDRQQEDGPNRMKS